MNKKSMIIVVTILLITGISYSIYSILNNKKERIEEKEKFTLISEEIEDDCTDEYIEEAKAVVSEPEKVSANASLILKKYYKQCEHTINENVELPHELVNKTKEEVVNMYPDWEVIGFSPEKVTLYKEYDSICDEHFKLKIEDGKIVVYIINKDGQESIYEKTSISSEYLTETDLINMQDGGIDIYGKQELNQLIEDFE